MVHTFCDKTCENDSKQINSRKLFNNRKEYIYFIILCDKLKQLKKNEEGA